jgi:Leucine-rich repeat (LRR) protein
MGLTKSEIKKFFEYSGAYIKNERGDIVRISKELNAISISDYDISELEEPGWLPYARKIRKLRLVNCNLESIPKWVFKMKKLEILDLQDNPGITKLPYEIVEMPELKTINLTNTGVKAIPSEIVNSKKQIKLLLGSSGKELNLRDLLHISSRKNAEITLLQHFLFGNIPEYTQLSKSKQEEFEKLSGELLGNFNNGQLTFENVSASTIEKALNYKTLRTICENIKSLKLIGYNFDEQSADKILKIFTKKFKFR